MTSQLTGTASFISSENIFAHWQGHRRLTRKTIEAFPEDLLFTYSIGGMRPFAAMVQELIDLADDGMKGVVTGKWAAMEDLAHCIPGASIQTKDDLLKEWDAVTEKLNAIWPLIGPDKFAESMKAFGLYEASGADIILYWIDNEIHHRAQGFVYLRSAGITPPAFYDRY